MGRTILLLPGLDGTGDLFAPFLSAAPPYADCRVVSYPPDVELSYAQLVEFVAMQVSVGEQLVVVGESFSGPVAVRIGRRLHEQVTSVVLCNSFITPPRPRVFRYFARTAMFRFRMPDQILAALMLAPLATASLSSALSVALQKVQPEVLAYRIRQVLSVDDRATVRDLTVPVVYLRGTLDRLVPHSAVTAVAQAAASFHLAEIAAPHALLQTAPAAAWLGINAALGAAG